MDVGFDPSGKLLAVSMADRGGIARHSVPSLGLRGQAAVSGTSMTHRVTKRLHAATAGLRGFTSDGKRVIYGGASGHTWLIDTRS